MKSWKFKNKARVILDYAHTPHALKTLLLDIRKEFPLSKVSLIFGCGGNRDKEKRSMMGTIARKYSNNIYLTDDNPRFENPELIRNEVKKALNQKNILKFLQEQKL